MAIKSFTWMALVAVLVFGGCRSPSGGGSELASDISMNSSRAAKQLLTGFYNVENGAWRWTGKSFAVQLAVPSGASSKGGKLTFRFVFPEPAVQTLHAVTLSAKANDTALDPQTYSASGDQTYARDVPAEALAAAVVRVTFSLDKAMPPGPVDVRELGVIAKEISLASR